MRFEHFVFTLKGPHSEENALLKLWKAINRYNKTQAKEQRNSLAIAIHKTFVFEQSKLSVPIPTDMLERLDPDIPYDRPSTPVLKKLQLLAEQDIKSVLEEFLRTEGESHAITEEREKLKCSSKKVESLYVSATCTQHEAVGWPSSLTAKCLATCCMVQKCNS